MSTIKSIHAHTYTYIPVEIFRHIGSYLDYVNKLNIRFVVKNLYPVISETIRNFMPDTDQIHQLNIWHLPLSHFIGYIDAKYSTKKAIKSILLGNAIPNELLFLENPWGIMDVSLIESIVINAYKYMRHSDMITTYIQDYLLDEDNTNLKSCCEHRRVILDNKNIDVIKYNLFNKIMNTIKSDPYALTSFINNSNDNNNVIQFDDIFVPEYLQYPRYTEALFRNLMCMKISLMYNFQEIKKNITKVYLEKIQNCGHECVMNTEGCVSYAWTFGYVESHEKLIVTLADKKAYYSALNTGTYNTLVTIIDNHNRRAESFDEDIRENEEWNWSSQYKIIGIHD